MSVPVGSETMVDYVLHEAPPGLMKNDLGHRLMTTVFGLPADIMNEAMDEAALCQFSDQPAQPTGAETQQLLERGLIDYLVDTRDTRKARAWSAWITQQTLLTPSGIPGELAAAGYGNSMIVSTLHGTGLYPFLLINDVGANYGNLFTDSIDKQYPDSSVYNTQFIVIVPCATFTEHWLTWDTWDQDGITLDMPGIYFDQIQSAFVSDQQLDEIRRIVTKHKPCDWVCRELVLLSPAITVQWNNGDFSNDPESVLTLGLGDIERWSSI